jgi:hypothetical protein
LVVGNVLSLDLEGSPLRDRFSWDPLGAKRNFGLARDAFIDPSWKGRERLPYPEPRRGTEPVSATPNEAKSPKKDARWPFVMLYLFMWVGMIMTTLNRDPIKFEFSIAIVFGLLAIAGIIVFLAHGRIRGRSPFTFDLYPTIAGNLALHVFILTGVMFIGYIFFGSVVQIMILRFNAPIFEPSCVAPSQRDVALFVWDAMARGAFKFVAKYLHIAHDGCTPNATSWTARITSLCLTGFTSFVLVWYAISFGKAYYVRLRGS